MQTLKSLAWCRWHQQKWVRIHWYYLLSYTSRNWSDRVGFPAGFRPSKILTCHALNQMIVNILDIKHRSNSIWRWSLNTIRIVKEANGVLGWYSIIINNCIDAAIMDFRDLIPIRSLVDQNAMLPAELYRTFFSAKPRHAHIITEGQARCHGNPTTPDSYVHLWLVTE